MNTSPEAFWKHLPVIVSIVTFFSLTSSIRLEDLGDVQERKQQQGKLKQMKGGTFFGSKEIEIFYFVGTERRTSICLSPRFPK